MAKWHVNYIEKSFMEQALGPSRSQRLHEK